MAHQAEMILGFASAADDYLQFRRLALCVQSTPEAATHEKAEGPSALARASARPRPRASQAFRVSSS